MNEHPINTSKKPVIYFGSLHSGNQCDRLGLGLEVYHHSLSRISRDRCAFDLVVMDIDPYCYRWRPGEKECDGLILTLFGAPPVRVDVELRESISSATRARRAPPVLTVSLRNPGKLNEFDYSKICVGVKQATYEYQECADPHASILMNLDAFIQRCVRQLEEDVEEEMRRYSI